MNRVEALERILDRQLGWIGAADAKLGFCFSAKVAMLGVLAALAPESASTWSTGAAVASALAATPLLAGLVFLFIAALPRTDGPKGSLVYFGGIVQKERAVFLAEATQLDEESYARDLATQCHRNAEIANRKFESVQKAMRLLFLAILPWLCAVFFLYGSS